MFTGMLARLALNRPSRDSLFPSFAASLALALALVLVRSSAALVLNMRAPRFRDRVQLAYLCLSVATRRHVTASDANPRSRGGGNSQSRNATACVVVQINESTG